MVELAAKLSATDNPELADAFLAFILTDTFQNLIPEETGHYQLPYQSLSGQKAFQELPLPDKVLFYSEEEAASLRDVSIEEWRRATFQIIASAAVAAFVLCPLWAVWRYSNGVVHIGEAEWAAFWFYLETGNLSRTYIGLFCSFSFACFGAQRVGGAPL